MTLSQLFQAALGRPGEGWTKVHEITGDFRLVRFWRKGEELLVSFYGTLGNPARDFSTKNVGDWLRDLRGWKKAYSVGSRTYRAHAGFVEEYLSMREEIANQILVYQPRVVTLVGFSQGAAHATLCHRDLLHNFEGMEVHTTAFASPRVYDFWGGAEFDYRTTNRITSSFERVTAYKDPVARLAPWWFGYAHVGPETVVGGKCWWLLPVFDHHSIAHYTNILEGK